MKNDDSSASGSPATGRQKATPGPTQAQLKSRVRRLEVLRGAARAITPSIAGQPTTSPFDGTELAAQLALLGQRIAALEECDDPVERDAERRSITRALAEVDQSLGAAGLNLLRITDGIPLVQLRASLPSIARQRRFDVLALLDLLVQDQRGILDRSVLFDYLVTLLATEEEDGKRWVAHDPVALIPRLRLLCQRAESKGGEAAGEAEEEFYAAASPERAPEELEPLLARIRKRKQGLGQLLFVPGVLRAVVTYNIAIANRIENELQQTKQDSDHEMLGLSAFVGDEDDSDLPPDEQGLQTPTTGSEDAPEEVGSVFESAAISAVGQAIRNRAEGGQRGTTVHQRIASRIDISDLKDAERAHLSAVDAEGPERALGRAIVVGLLLRTTLESALDMRAIGINPERLRTVWAIEVDRALQEQVTERLLSNSYQEACALTELKTRFLYESVAAVANRLRKSQPKAPPSAGGLERSELRALAEDTRAAAAAMAVSVPEQDAPAKGRLGRHRQVLLGALAAVLSAVALMNIVGTPSRSIQYLDAAELEVISEHLGAGYRNDTGTLFIGTLNESWQHLADADQRQAAKEMVEALTLAGVDEVMAFDGHRRLCVQGAAGKLRIPGIPRG
jgi:hypothetical protein